MGNASTLGHVFTMKSRLPSDKTIRANIFESIDLNQISANFEADYEQYINPETYDRIDTLMWEKKILITNG